MNDVMKTAVVNSYRLAWQHEKFLDHIVQKLGTCLCVPEEEIVVEGVYDLEERFMYFISKGDCYVNQRDQFGQEQ